MAGGSYARRESASSAANTGAGEQARRRSSRLLKRGRSAHAGVHIRRPSRVLPPVGVRLLLASVRFLVVADDALQGADGERRALPATDDQRDRAQGQLTLPGR